MQVFGTCGGITRVVDLTGKWLKSFKSHMVFIVDVIVDPLGEFISMENLPCRRCSHASLECLFEKPTREAGLGYVLFHPTSPHQLTHRFSFRQTRSLKSHVADIHHSQIAIQSVLMEIVSRLRNGLGPTCHSPLVYQPPPFTLDFQSQDSPAAAAASTPTNVLHSQPPCPMADARVLPAHGPHQQQIVVPGHQPQLSVMSSSHTRTTCSP